MGTQTELHMPDQVRESAIKLAIAVCGIYVFYIIYGLAQERINSTRYGQDQERFNFTVFLVLIQCVFNVLLASVGRQFSTPFDQTIESRVFAKMALSYIAAMFCSNTAIFYTSYPTQVLVKSCKMIPVMLVNMIRGTKVYSLQQKFCVVLITLGIAVFMLNKSATKLKPGAIEDSSVTGLVLCGLSLLFDGVTGNVQDSMLASHKPPPYQIMFSINFFASGFLLIAAVATGDIIQGPLFVLRHPQALIDLAIFGTTSALGQSFIFYTIANFGALPCATITTTRKLFTIFVSVLWFGHNINPLQWVGVMVVFGALAWDINTKRLNMQSKSGGSKRDLAPLLPPDQVHLLGTLGSEDVSELAGTPRSNNAELC